MVCSRRHFIELLAATVALSACKKKAPEGTGPAGGAIGKVRVSMIPSTEPGKMLRQGPLLTAHLERAIGGGAKVDLTIPTSYAAVVEALVSDQLDFAYLGGFTYVQARKRAMVIPLVQRTKDREFHSVFITQAGSDIHALSGLAGKKFAFGDVNSTSGHLMPEYFMREAKVDPETLAKAAYTGGHDATALSVMHGHADAGAMDELVFERMKREGKLDASKVRVFYTTPPFFDYVWVARKNVAAATREAFAKAFLGLDKAQAAHAPVLEMLGGERFVRADDADYEKLREAATAAGLLQ